MANGHEQISVENWIDSEQLTLKSAGVHSIMSLQFGRFLTMFDH